MATRIYTGVDGKARKVKRIYVGVDGKARSVKKVYVGVNGKARLCWMKPDIFKYDGSTLKLCANKASLAATSIGDYALFGGGCPYGTPLLGTQLSVSKHIDVISSSLTISTAPELDNITYYLAAASNSKYALFAGGSNPSSPNYYLDSMKDLARDALNTVCVYDTLLTKLNSLYLGNGKASCLSGASVSDTILFAGGVYLKTDSYFIRTKICNRDCVSAFNEDLTIKTSKLPFGACDMASTSFGEYALFAGGRSYSDKFDNEFDYTALDCVNAFDKSLTLHTLNNLSTTRFLFSGTSTNNYAFFAGGNGKSSDVDVYDKNLSHTNSLSLSNPKFNLASTSVGEYVIFSGGYNNDFFDTVDIFDDGLTRIKTTTLSEKKYHLSSSTIGNYSIFAGGIIKTKDDSTNKTTTDSIDIFQCVQ